MSLEKCSAGDGSDLSLLPLARNLYNDPPPSKRSLGGLK
jgi:hypothetical protein